MDKAKRQPFVTWSCLEGLESRGPYKMLTDERLRELRRDLDECVELRKRAEDRLKPLRHS